MIWIGAIICVLTFVGIILKFDTKLCLIAGGFLMCLLGGGVTQVVSAYCASLINGSVVYITCISMGYATIMNQMGCCDHLVYACLKPMSKIKGLVVPFSCLIGVVVMMGVGSAATCGTVAGSLLIPMMLSLGVSPATAGAAVLLSSGISISINPGSSFVVMAVEADPTGVCTGKDIIDVGFLSCWVSLVVAVVLFTLISSFLDKGKKGETDENLMAETLAKAAAFKVNGLYAIMPVVPLILILVANYTPLLDAKVFDVPTCMFLGWILAMIVFAKDYKKVTTMFFKGQGDAFFSIITLMAAAAVFTKGMSVIGITDALVNAMKSNPSIASLGACFGPLIIAALSGSGNAAMIAFIDSVLPHAGEIGIPHDGLSALVLRTGNFGRTFSPVAAVTIICAGIAGADPMDLCKRTAIPCLVISVLTMVMVV